MCWEEGGGLTTRVMANMTVAVLLISVTMLATCATSMGTACATAGATCRLLTPMNCRCAGTELRSQQARRQNRCDGVRGGVEDLEGMRQRDGNLGCAARAGSGGSPQRLEAREPAKGLCG